MKWAAEQASASYSHYDRLELEGKTVWLPRPAVIPAFHLVEREEILNRMVAASLSIGGLAPLNFRLYGPPGSGKNTLVYRLAQILQRDLYIINGHEELGPEDIACTPTMTSSQSVEYVASPLFAAMMRGGICFFDEIGKAPISALDPLASALDDRRALTSVIAGIHQDAHPDFLFCAALNLDEEESLRLPEFIDERTRPAIEVGYPPAAILERILRSHLPKAADSWFKVFLRSFDNALSPRSAITLLSYAYRLSSREGQQRPTERQIKAYLDRAYPEVAIKRETQEAS